MEMENGFSPYPDFLRIFNSQEHSQRLVFPRVYKEYYPEPLPQTAVLKKSEGKFWTVKWTVSRDETISFQDGWEKFVKDNGVIDRDFLLFTYDGSRRFWVRHHRNGLAVEASAPINIEEISDDEDEATDGDDADHHIEDEDNHENMIISRSLGSNDEAGDDDDYDDDDDDTAISEADEASVSSKKARRIVRKHRDPDTYHDDPKNPFFISTSSCSRRDLIISMKVIREYNLRFNSTINLIDGFGALKTRVGVWNDRVVVFKWDEMYTRNNAKREDVIICEIIREEDVVLSIKVHFVKK